MTPREMSEREEWLGAPQLVLPALKVGTDLGNLDFKRTHELFDTLKAFHTEKYMLFLQKKKSTEVHIIFKENIELKEMVKAILHAFMVRRLLTEEGFQGDGEEWFDIVKRAKKSAETKSHFGDKKTIMETFLDRLFDHPGAEKYTENTECEVEGPQTEGAERTRGREHHGWLVEELMLETRYARVVVPDTVSEKW